MDAYNSRPNDAFEADATVADPVSRLKSHSDLDLTREDLEEAFSIAGLGVWHWQVGSVAMSWSNELYRIAGRDPRFFAPTLERALSCIHPQDRQGANERLFTKAVAGLAEGYEFRVVRPDGGERHCWAKTRLVAGRGGPDLVHGVLLDITDRRRAEAALAESEENYRHAMELNPQIPWSATPEGEIIDAGARWSLEVDAELGDWPQALHPDDRAPTLQAWQHSLATGAPIDLRYRLHMKCGAYRWFRARAGARRDEAGRILRWYGQLEDIQTQVEGEAEARERDAWILHAHEAAAIGLFEVDFIAGTAKLSPQSLVLHGLPAESDPVLRAWDDWAGLIHPDDAEEGRLRVREAGATGKPYDFTFRVPLPDGGIRWINGLGRIEADEAGRPLRLIGVNMDVTGRRTAELKLQESEALNRTIVEASPDSIKLIGADGVVVFVNGSSLTSMELDDGTALVGRRWLDLWPASARPRAGLALDAALAGRHGRFTAARATARGTPKWWDVVMSPVLDEQGRVHRLVAISRDITQQKHAEERIRWSATHDPLTLLPNRRMFEERLAGAIEEAETSGGRVALIALDLDNLKQVNDTLGHDAGNAILQMLGKRLVPPANSPFTAARLGGDEFALLLPGIAGAAEANAIAAALLDRLREPFVHAGSTLDCRASIGFSLFPDQAANASELLKQSDLALYASKGGRGGVQMFEPQMRAEVQQRISQMNIAQDALEAKRLFAFFQPKVDLATGHVDGFEALLRWHDPHGGLHLPASIGAAFEDPDLALAISERIVDLAVTAIRGWAADGERFGHVAINASAADLCRRDYATWLLARIAAGGVAPASIQLEVTETVFLGRGAHHVQEQLKALSAAGVRIALDDFGTGYASLSHLKQFPVDVIKIDRSFVGDIREGDDRAAIVTAITDLGRALGIEVVAEGVETMHQAMRLRRLGCRYGQGFLFSEAVPVAEVPGLLARTFAVCQSSND